MNNIVEIKYFTEDSFGRAVYKTKEGSFIVKIDKDYYNVATYPWNIPGDFEGEPEHKLNSKKLKIVQEFNESN